MGIKTEKQEKQPIIKIYEFYYVPCINCCNQINIDDVSKHSEICINVKEDLINLELANSFKAIDFKLMKLRDHINNIKNKLEENKNKHHKDEHYLTAIFIYLTQIIGSFLFLFRKHCK